MSDRPSELNLTEEQRTELVAYLDGELRPEDAERVRNLLAENAEARRAAEELTIAWESLDHLEGIQASGDFTQRTMSTIEALAETEVVGERQPVDLRRGTVVAGWVLGIVLSGIGGFCFTNWTMDQDSEQLVRDLDMIRSLPKYERAESVEVLEAIEKQELFDARP